MRRFPRRTLLLMALALLAFVRLYVIAHREPKPAAPPPPEQARAPAPAAPACPPLERALQGALRDPQDATAWTTARRELDACPTLPARACEVGVALDARAPLGDAGPQPLRELLDTLCQRCPAGRNPCASTVVRAVMAVSATGQSPLASPRWHLERAGPGMPEACSEVAQSLLAPAALDEGPLSEASRTLLGELGPICARAGLLPAPLLRAAAVQGAVPARDWLAAEAPSAAHVPLTPDRLLGPTTGSAAFDHQDTPGVELSRLEQDPSWRKNGALSGVFSPPAREVSGLRVKAQGSGSVRAVVRVDPGLGLHDPDTQASFVLPLVCRFKGTGQWEACTPSVTLQDVEAISVFPDKRSLVLSEMEIRGTR